MTRIENAPLPSAFCLLSSGELIAFVGGGGKTSLMFALARALVAGGKRVGITTTTRIFAAQMKQAPAVLATEDTESTEEERLGRYLDRFGSCLVVSKVEGDKALGVPADLPVQLLARPDVDFVLVEADGSRMRPVKAPAGHEPVVPAGTTLLVPVVGIDVLDGPIREVAHRPELVVRLLNSGQWTVDSEQWAVGSEQLTVNSEQYEVTDRLSVQAVARLLAHPLGGLKNTPDGARVIPFINKVETDAQLAAARQVAGCVLQAPRITQVVIGAVRSQQPVREVHRRVTAVVLAAGESKRMGQETKQLLPWGETTVLGQTLRNLKQTMVHEIVVVSGHQAEAVEAIAAAERANAIRNTQYATGEMLSSLQTAVRRLPPDRAAVLVMLADQPMVEPETVDQLLEGYWQGLGELIAPVFNGRRGNPVLIGRPYFDELLALPPGAAPRDLLKKHRDELCLVAVASDSVLRDLDVPEEYERWRPT